MHPARRFWTRAYLAPSLALAMTAPTRADVSGPVQVAGGRSEVAFDIPNDHYRLPNGLGVILHRNAELPMVAINLWYHVGPAREPPGRSGFAHLFEHLMFEGSKHVGKRLDELLESVGASNVNGTTSWDRTNYYETVPSEHLELALWIEADRMGFMPEVLSADRLEVQREVVKNERRESFENSPYGPSTLAMYERLFPAPHPYHGAIIGSMRDLSRATLRDVADFFRAYYRPCNATLAIVGNFDPTLVRRMIEKHFGTLPAPGCERPRLPPRLPRYPAPVAGRIQVVEDVELPRVVFAWRVPPAYSNAEPALNLAAQLLGQGKASRLYQALVVPGIASSVDVTLDANQLASVFAIEARAASGRAPAEVEKALSAEIERWLREGPTPAELDRAKKRLKVYLASDLQQLNSSSGEGGIAGTLQRLNHYLGQPRGLAAWVAAHESVDSARVVRAVRTYLPTASRLVVVTVPAPPAAGDKTGHALGS